jgi:hypothetical protein
VALHILLPLVPAGRKIQTAITLFFQISHQPVAVEEDDIKTQAPVLVALVEVETDRILAIIRAAQEIHPQLHHRKEIMVAMVLTILIILLVAEAAPVRWAKPQLGVVAALAALARFGHTLVIIMLVAVEEVVAVGLAVELD